MADLSDPVRDLNNFLQDFQIPKNLTPFLAFTSVQSGPNIEAVHTGMYQFRGVVVGSGSGVAKYAAKRDAATQALQYFHSYGIPDNTHDHVHELNSYLQEAQKPENLVPFLQFSIVQSGPNPHAVLHTGTYTFHGVVVGRVTGTSIAVARRTAAAHALRYFHTVGIPVYPQPFTFPISVG